jgi:hypothetical protein
MIIGTEKQMDTYFMTNGSKTPEMLPELLWEYFIVSLSHVLANKFNTELPSDVQVFTAIPDKEREWISLDTLSNSVFAKKKNLIGLDFDIKNPIISDGKFWINTIRNSIENDLSIESRNIYVFDSKMKLFVFYIEGGGILIAGDQKHLAKLS